MSVQEQPATTSRRARKPAKKSEPAPKKSAAKKPSKYPERVREMSRLANATRGGGSFRIGPKQASIVLATLEREADGPLTEKDLLRLCGVSEEGAREHREGTGDTKPVRPLAAKVEPPDAYARSPRWLAALCFAAIETLEDE